MFVMTSPGAKRMKAYAYAVARGVGWKAVRSWWTLDLLAGQDKYILTLSDTPCRVQDQPGLQTELRFGRAAIVGYGQGHGVEAIQAQIRRALTTDRRPA